MSVGGLSHSSPIKSVTSFQVSPTQSPNEKFTVTAVIVPKVTCDLPRYHVPFDCRWSHLSDIELADPEFGIPGQIDVLLGVDVFVEVLLHGRWVGPPHTSVAIETKFGWIIAGAADTEGLADVVSHYTITDPDMLKRFWEIEELPRTDSACWSMEERTVVN